MMNALAFPGSIPDPAQAAEIRLRVLSLGAGVQSTTLALMAAHGEIGPMPDCAIFADTGWEPNAVYEHLAWLGSPNVLPFPIHIVSAGDIWRRLAAGAAHLLLRLLVTRRWRLLGRVLLLWEERLGRDSIPCTAGYGPARYRRCPSGNPATQFLPASRRGQPSWSLLP